MPAKLVKQQKRRGNHKKSAANGNHKKKASKNLKNGQHPEMEIEQNGVSPEVLHKNGKTPTSTSPSPSKTPSKTASTFKATQRQNAIAILQRRRMQSSFLGDECLNKHNFEMARLYFEQALNRQMARTKDEENKEQTELLPPLSNELDIYFKLLICRMHLDNSKSNLAKAMHECDFILSQRPNSVQHYIIKAELSIRMNRFEEVGPLLVKAAEMDQPAIKDSVHLYLNQIAKATDSDGSDVLKLGKKGNLDLEKLCKFWDSLTLISQQNLMSLEWEQIVEAIDSELCDEILDPVFGEEKKENESFKLFLKKVLKWNLPRNDKQQSLIFLKVEFAYVLARTLWDGLSKKHLPKEPENEKCKSMEEAIAIDCKPTYFLENGLFGCRDGYDFVSAAVFEPSMCLSSVFDIVNEKNKKLYINHLWLYQSGVKLLHWLAETPLYHVKHLKRKDLNDPTEWDRFMETRINAHYAIDPELNETVLSRDAHEDGKKFEEAMEKLVGTKKKNQLMQLELDLSIPILSKYADIMSAISGIDKDTLIYELTLPDEEEDQKDNNPALTSALLQQYLNDPKFKDYKPVGLPVLVQNAEFNILPSKDKSSEYDRSKILHELSLLEKEVVQFQIDYKNKVYQVAGDQANELDKVMSTLQYRGLELTKWLRNFVKYMISRRDIEQEIVDVSEKESHKEAMEWFESMTNYLNGANNILLKIVTKLFMANLETAFNKYSENKNKNKEIGFEKHEIYKGKKIEKLTSRYFELDMMVKFYLCLKKEFESTMADKTFESLDQVTAFLESSLLHSPSISQLKDQLLSSLKMHSIKVPVLEIKIPGTIIENQYSSAYKSWIGYPLTQTFVEKTKLFIERCKYLRDNIFCIIYSTVEKRCLLYPTLQNAPNKYFKCIGCDKIYASLLCTNCNLAHYCSKECQSVHWDKSHKRECKKYASLSRPTATIMLPL